jgi:5-carboxymethyl-2-hydroxymuconate isomerase
MPHCVIEYSAPLSARLCIQELLERVHQGAFDSGLFDLGSIKTRAIAFDYYAVGETPEAQFIHIRCALMPGRTAEQKKQLLAGIHAAIATLVIEVDSLTMEVVELDALSYFKRLSAPCDHAAAV